MRIADQLLAPTRPTAPAGPSPHRSGRSVRNGIATVLMGLVLRRRAGPARLRARHGRRQGRVGASRWEFLTDSTSRPAAAHRPRHGPGGRRHARDHRLTADADRRAARHPRRGLPQRVRRHAARRPHVLRFIADVMTGVPSIVMGLFIYTIWVVRFGITASPASPARWRSACLMLPIVIRSTEEMLRLVPDHLREASYALGAAKARTIADASCCPPASPGIVSGVLLAVARAAGETAPLLFTIGAATRSTGTCSAGRTRRCRCRSSPTPSSRSSAPRSGRGARR